LKKLILIVFIAFTMLLNNQCEYNIAIGYEIVPVYDTILSYPGGGGIFKLWLDCPTYNSGEFSLNVNADPKLHAKLNKLKISKDEPVFELTIQPEENIVLDDYIISISALYNRPKGAKEISTTDVVVKVSDWGFNKNDAEVKLNDFKNHLISINNRYSEIFDESIFSWSTYTNILIVEHSTWLSENYEVRLCYHVMVPPNDWSKLCIRKRNSLSAEKAFMRDTQGAITEISVADYPQLHGY